MWQLCLNFWVNPSRFDALFFLVVKQKFFILPRKDEQLCWKLSIFLLTGGIIGLGEAEEDRVGLLHTLATLPTHPESVPINALVAVKGTPLQDQKVILFLLDTMYMVAALAIIVLHIKQMFYCTNIQIIFSSSFVVYPLDQIVGR